MNRPNPCALDCGHDLEDGDEVCETPGGPAHLVCYTLSVEDDHRHGCRRPVPVLLTLPDIDLGSWPRDMVEYTCDKKRWFCGHPSRIAALRLWREKGGGQ